MAHRNAKEFYDAGGEAKRRGLFRLSPYYEQARADYWWLAGFDGMDFDEAAEKQPEFEARVVSPAAVRATGMPVPEDVAAVHFHDDERSFKKATNG